MTSRPRSAATLPRFNARLANSPLRPQIKFFAPWCGHCKAMKPAWDELGTEYSDSSSVLIADVDCTAESSKGLCEKHGVNGFPTIKSFTSDTGKDGQDYEGGRDLESLKAYVSENLAAKCLIAEPAACTEKEVGFIAKMQAKGGKAEAAAELKRLEGLKGNPMAPDLKKWVNQRVAILQQLAK